MTDYLSDRNVRDYTDRMLADSAAARQVRQVRRERRAARAQARRSVAVAATARQSTRSSRTARAGNATAHFVTRPFAAAHSWIAAGEL
jgi:hypothetical protein